MLEYLKRAVLFILFSFISLLNVSCGKIEMQKVTLSEKLSYSVIYSAEKNKKLPVIIFTHNGNGTAAEWGDYPEIIAGIGYFSVVVSYKENHRATVMKDIVEDVKKKFKNNIDHTKFVFVGGCHGGIINSHVFDDLSGGVIDPGSIKALVYLSLTELLQLPESHPPVLTIYSTEDHLGKKYQEKSKRIAEHFTDPKTIIEIEGTPHGAELVSDPLTKERVRKEVTKFILLNMK